MRYSTGLPCKFGHIAERRVSNGMCAVCAQIKSKRFYKANREFVHKRSTEWARANRDKTRSYRNPEKNREWKNKNIEKVRSYDRNRKARKGIINGSHSGEDISDIFKMQKGKCGYCRSKLGKKYHVDHIMPLALNGSNSRDNLQILCVLCNLRKAARDPVEYAQSLGKLI